MISYSIITPVKNEVLNIATTIESVVNQSMLPVEWVIIDDNSNDGSEIILTKAAEKYSWIKLIKPEEYKIDDYSSRVVHLFNYGLKKIGKPVDFISKLDGDVSFNSNFYSNILKQFQNNPKLGIASGYLTIKNIPEKNQNTNYICTRGATKVYRLNCLNDIGGIICFQGWDTLDNVAARALSWEVAILPEYFEHLKEEGSKVGNKYYSQYRTGVYNGAVPYLWGYFLLKAISKTFNTPFFIGALLQIAGYINGRFFSKLHPYPEFIVNRLHFEQRETLKSLFKL